MSQLLVRGGRALAGEVTIQGAKNSVLPILAATILARGQVVLRGCPALRDVDASVRILQSLGCEARWEADTLAVDTTALNSCGISDILMREMRSSAIFLGAILARCGRRTSAIPAGVSWGRGPLTCIFRGCGTWERRFGKRGAFSTARRPGLRGGSWC